MRLFGGRTIRNAMRRQAEDKQESRDAGVISVDTTNRIATVKVQGSDEPIYARYPENFESTPQFLKPGNAVRISSPGGNRGRIEIIGHGLLLPTAIPGGSMTPATPTSGDTILTGLSLIAADPPAMSATVTTGTYRIDGVTYILGVIEMDRPDIEMDRFDLEMDGGADVVSFDAASSSQFRYDIVVAGTDGDAHVVKGANNSGEPEMPSTPADHVRVGWVLLYPGMTEITQADINRLYTDPAITELRVTVADHDLAWTDPLSTTISVSVRDQYGRVVTGSYELTIAFVTGNGTLEYGGSSSGSGLTFNFSGSASITYTRDGDDPGDSSPTFSIEETMSGLDTATYIILRDAAGGVMVSV